MSILSQSPKTCCGSAPLIYPVTKYADKKDKGTKLWCVSCATCGRTISGQDKGYAIREFNRRENGRAL